VSKIINHRPARPPTSLDEVLRAGSACGTAVAGGSASIYHGVDTEAQASPKRFAEASTEKKRLLEIRLCQTQSLISSNDLLLEKDGSQFHA